MRLLDRFQSIKLRRKGWSYSQIRKQLNVPKGTLSYWLRGVKLSPRQEAKILDRLEVARIKAGKTKWMKRIIKTKEITEAGRKEFLQLAANPLFLIGLSLYWAEGDKNIRERVKFTNSDPASIQLMMKWFRRICKVPERKFRIALHIHNLHINRSVKEYWANLTGIPLTQFHKIVVKESTLSQRRNVLYNGTCSIVINNKDLFRRIMGWRLGLLKHFSISPRSSMDRMEDF